MLTQMILVLIGSIGIYFLIVNLIYGVLVFFSWRKIKTFKTQLPKNLPPVSFLVPAYNEESLIVETIQTYLSVTDKEKEIIVIDDGSHDKTMSLLKVMYQLVPLSNSSEVLGSLTHPELKVIRAAHQGKARALNLGLKHAQYEIICTLDADTIPTAKGVEECLASFSHDPGLIAVGGVIQVLSGQELQNNRPLKKKTTEWITAFQRIEYLRTFICERLGWSFLGSTILISGAFCMVKKKAIQRIGGFKADSITEDFDLILRLRKSHHKKEHRFKILPVTTCYTQAPKTLSHLCRQRMRWQIGLMQTLWQNGTLLKRPLAIPYFWLVEVLSPVMVFLALITIPLALFSGWLDIKYVLTYLSIGLIYNLLITMIGFRLDKKYVVDTHNDSTKKETMLTSLWDTLLIHFGYKQLNACWRLIAMIKGLSKVSSWGEKPRVELIHH